MKKKKYHSKLPIIIPNQDFYNQSNWLGNNTEQRKEEDKNFENQKKLSLRKRL